MLAQLDTAFAEREAREEQLRRFAADASHELRTPVAAIRGYAELYQQGGIPPGKSLDRAIARIGSESTRMGRLVEDLLLLARLDQQQPLEWSQVDLSVLVRDAAADVRALDPDRSVTAEASGPVVVRGDERRLRQVVTNLVTNARTHTPEGTPIHLRARLDTASAEAVLEVADEGPGIDPEIRTRVFDRFFRGDKSRKVGTGGSGLGLSIVAGVVSAHGGGVDIADFDPHGASFVVRLPLWSGDRNAT
jgi:two-component system OmpR family sensor kinase